MSKNILAFFHYALFAAVPVFLVLLFDGWLWTAFLPNVQYADALAIPVLVVLCTLVGSLFMFVARLVVDAHYREACFSGLAGLRERDEREQRIVGHAARETILLSLVVLVGLCFASLFEFSFDSNGLTSFVIERERAEFVVAPRAHDGDTVVNVVPLSKTGVLILMFALQPGAFRYFSMGAAFRGKANS